MYFSLENILGRIILKNKPSSSFYFFLLKKEPWSNYYNYVTN